MNEENTSFAEFAEAFDDTADNQTDSIDETAAEEDTPQESNAAENTDIGAADGVDGEQSQDANTPEEAATESAKDAEKSASDTFTLKVNKEEKTYSREEVITLAQKGADYDRVKDQLAQSRQTAEGLQGKLDGQQETMDILADVAKEMNMEIPALLDNLRIGVLKKQGLSEEAAKERLLRIKTEKENASLKAAAAEAQPKETGAQRAQRELAEFRETYPDVELTQEVLDKLMPDVQGGMSLTKSYQKQEMAQKDAEIAELQRQLAAEKQNKENLASSPGSQKDSGGKRAKSDFDEFMEAFN